MNVRLFAALLIALSILTGCSIGKAAATLTNEEAKQTALNHAGLTKDQVTRMKTEFDYDDGVPEYNVEFYYDGWEYDYEINAQTGKILSWDKEYDD